MVSVTAGKEWNGAKVRCEVTDKQGNKIYSEPITVSVNTKLRIISQPSDKSLRPEEDVRRLHGQTAAVGKSRRRRKTAISVVLQKSRRRRMEHVEMA